VEAQEYYTMAKSIIRNRIDLSEWVIHFVHDRMSEDNPQDLQSIAEMEGYDGDLRMPDYYDDNGCPHNILTEYEENEYVIDDNAPAFDVLLKILHDGYIHSGWSLRNFTPTIFGPRSAVCFTEMPLHALVEYAKFRGDYSGYVGNYGIAFRRRELFAAGARPVIYGISKKIGETNKQYHSRMFDPERTELPKHELYRYVFTDIQKDGKSIDWTHEREWRWALPNDTLHVPGIPFFLSKEYADFFSEIVLIVGTDEEQNEVLSHLKNLFDSGSTNSGINYDTNKIAAAKVLSLESLAKQNNIEEKTIRIDDLNLKQLPILPHISVSQETEIKVREAIAQANKIKVEAVADYLKTHPEFDEQKGEWGWATVCTNTQSEVTQAMQNLGVCHTYADGVYRISLNGFHTSNLDLLSIGAEEAARYLEKTLGQQFYYIQELD